jgi:hypothetical protein
MKKILLIVGLGLLANFSFAKDGTQKPNLIKEILADCSKNDRTFVAKLNLIKPNLGDALACAAIQASAIGIMMNEGADYNPNADYGDAVAKDVCEQFSEYRKEYTPENFAKSEDIREMSNKKINRTIKDCL